MKLVELRPRWVIGDRFDTPDGVQHFIHLNYDHDRRGMGMSFECPVHRSHRLAIMFSNPIDNRPPQFGAKLWQRQGDTFETISITPSIDASATAEYPGCWHGHITNGEIR